MQSIFPYLLSWSLATHFLLRIVAGSYFMYFGYKGFTSEWREKISFFNAIKFKKPVVCAYIITIAEFLGGILLIMGLLTQLVALIFFIISIVGAIIEKNGFKTIQRNIHVYILLATICLTLFISGAGYYAMDLMV
jgi:putative oxidoreductase